MKLDDKSNFPASLKESNQQRVKEFGEKFK